jgi:hypothetical protein
MGENIHRVVLIVIKNSPSLSMFKLIFVQYTKCNDRFFAVIVAKISAQKELSKSIKLFIQTPFHFNVVSGESLNFHFCTKHLIMMSELLFLTLFLDSPKKFKNLPRLKTHEDIHNNTQYICNICGISLNTKRTLKMHMVKFKGLI